MVFRDRNKEKYDWDNEDISDAMDLTEDNPRFHNDLVPAELPGVDLEEDVRYSQIVYPTYEQSDAECM